MVTLQFRDHSGLSLTAINVDTYHVDRGENVTCITSNNPTRTWYLSNDQLNGTYGSCAVLDGDSLLTTIYHRTTIKGYQELSSEDLQAINDLKELENSLGSVVESLSGDPRWRAIGRTHLQQGFMALVRSIARPESKL